MSALARLRLPAAFDREVVLVLLRVVKDMDAISIVYAFLRPAPIPTNIWAVDNLDYSLRWQVRSSEPYQSVYDEATGCYRLNV
jgi:hypothetical protein